MDAVAFFGMEPTTDPRHWRMPVVPSLCSGLGALFGGAGLGACVEALEQATGRPLVWATGQYLSYARPPAVLDIRVTEVVRGHQVSQARAVATVDGDEILTVNAALGHRENPHSGSWAEMPVVRPPLDCPPRQIMDRHSGSIMDRIDMRMADARGFAERAGGNSLDNTLREVSRAQTEWILADIRVHAVADGFGHGLVHLWTEDGRLLGTASQSTIVRNWREEPPNMERRT